MLLVLDDQYLLDRLILCTGLLDDRRKSIFIGKVISECTFRVYGRKVLKGEPQIH
jgi:hypothetical protein